MIHQEGLDEPLIPKNCIPSGFQQEWDTRRKCYVLVPDHSIPRENPQSHVQLTDLRK